jgi:hypothetical protein
MTQRAPHAIEFVPLWGRLPTCGPITNRSIRAKPGRLFVGRRHALPGVVARASAGVRECFRPLTAASLRRRHPELLHPVQQSRPRHPHASRGAIASADNSARLPKRFRDMFPLSFGEGL